MCWGEGRGGAPAGPRGSAQGPVAGVVARAEAGVWELETGAPAERGSISMPEGAVDAGSGVR